VKRSRKGGGGGGGGVGKGGGRGARGGGGGGGRRGKTHYAPANSILEMIHGAQRDFQPFHPRPLW